MNDERAFTDGQTRPLHWTSAMVLSISVGATDGEVAADLTASGILTSL